MVTYNNEESRLIGYILTHIKSANRLAQSYSAYFSTTDICLNIKMTDMWNLTLSAQFNARSVEFTLEFDTVDYSGATACLVGAVKNNTMIIFLFVVLTLYHFINLTYRKGNKNTMNSTKGKLIHWSFTRR